jgi:hypothetical protein
MFGKLVGGKASANKKNSKEESWNASLKNKALPRSSLAAFEASSARQTLGGPNDLSDEDAEDHDLDLDEPTAEERAPRLPVFSVALPLPTQAAEEKTKMANFLDSDEEEEEEEEEGGVDSGAFVAATTPLVQTPPLLLSKPSSYDKNELASFLDSDEGEDGGVGSGGFVAAAPTTQPHAVKKAKKISSLLNSDDDVDEDVGNGNFVTAPVHSVQRAALAPKQPTPRTDEQAKMASFLGSDDSEGDECGGAGESGFLAAAARPGAAKSTAANLTSAPAANEVASFLNDSDDDEGDEELKGRLRQTPALALVSAASGKTAYQQAQVASFLDNSDEEDGPGEVPRPAAAPARAVPKASKAHAGRPGRAKSPKNAGAVASAGGSADGAAPPQRPGGGGPGEKQGSILKLNQFNKEAGHTLFQNLFRKRCVAARQWMFLLGMLFAWHVLRVAARAFTMQMQFCRLGHCLICGGDA